VPEYSVAVTRVSPRPTAVVAQTTTWQEFPRLWRQLLDEVYAFVRTSTEIVQETDVAPKWQNVMLYQDDRPAVEVGVLVPGWFTGEGRVIPSCLPGGMTAMTVHTGDYAGLADAHQAVRAFAVSAQLELAGPRWEIYGHWRADPGELETEVYYLLR
jgi:effector-binding domain-containing protein